VGRGESELRSRSCHADLDIDLPRFDKTEDSAGTALRGHRWGWRGPGVQPSRIAGIEPRRLAAVDVSVVNLSEWWRYYECLLDWRAELLWADWHLRHD